MKKEKTLVIVKPDGIQRSLIGEVIQRYEKAGLKLVGLKMLIASTDLIERHYSTDPEWKLKTGQKAIDAYKKQGKDHPISNDPVVVSDVVFKKLSSYMTAGPIIVMVWEGLHAVGIVRKITGGTEPLTSDMGTIRGDYTIDSYAIADIDNRAVRNIIHASGSVDEANKEIGIWFKEGELLEYRLINEAILYDINLDGILE